MGRASGARFVAWETREGMHTIGSPNRLVAHGGGLEWLQRTLVVMPATTSRWRLAVANRNAQTGAAPGQGGTLASVYIGEPEYPAGGRWAGACTAALDAAITEPLTVPTDGSDARSEWVTDPALQFQAGAPTALSIAATTNVEGTGVIASDCVAFCGLGVNNQVGAAATPGVAADFIWDVRIEYETVVPGGTPLVVVVGASGESGYNPDTGALPAESWPHVAARLGAFLVINGGVGSSVTSDWTSSSGRPYERLALSSDVPDVAVIGMLSSNDIGAMAGGDAATAGQIATHLALMKANFETIVDNLRADGADAVYAATIPPRGYSAAGSFENLRGQFNAWLRTLPLGLAGLLDFERALRDVTATSDLDPLLRSSDNIHPNLGGAQIIAGIAAAALVSNAAAL